MHDTIFHIEKKFMNFFLTVQIYHTFTYSLRNTCLIYLKHRAFFNIS